MPNKVNQEELRKMMTYQLYDSSIVDYKMAAIIDKAVAFTNSQVLQAIEKIKSKQPTLNDVIEMEPWSYADGKIINDHWLSAIEAIEKEYK